jgi:hypothetical protein
MSLSSIWNNLKAIPKAVWVFLAGAAASLILYFKFRGKPSSQGAPDPNIDRVGIDGWKKAESDKKKPVVENPLTEEEINAGEKHIRGLD